MARRGCPPRGGFSGSPRLGPYAEVNEGMFARRQSGHLEFTGLSRPNCCHEAAAMFRTTALSRTAKRVRAGCLPSARADSRASAQLIQQDLQFRQRFFFQLANALAGQAHQRPDLLECPGRALISIQPEAEREYLLLALG